MSVQTSYSRAFTAAFAGQLGDGDHRIAGRLNEEATNLGAGLGVAIGSTNEEAIKNLTSSSSKLAGIVINSFARNPGDITKTLASAEAVFAGEVADVLEEGLVYVVTEEAIVEGDDVYMRHTAGGGGSVIGAFRNDADTATCRQVKGARWVKGNTVAGVALLYVDVAVDRAFV